MKSILVHKSEIRIGDLIRCNDGYIRTVGKDDIKRNNFTGITIFGDCYKLGYQQVEKIIKL